MPGVLTSFGVCPAPDAKATLAASELNGCSSGWMHGRGTDRCNALTASLVDTGLILAGCQATFIACSLPHGNSRAGLSHGTFMSAVQAVRRIRKCEGTGEGGRGTGDGGTGEGGRGRGMGDGGRGKREGGRVEAGGGGGGMQGGRRWEGGRGKGGRGQRGKGGGGEGGKGGEGILACLLQTPVR